MANAKSQAGEQVAETVYKSQVTFPGSIKKVETFSSKGGGIKVHIESSDLSHIMELAEAQDMACEIIVQVSAHKITDGDDPEAGQMELEDLS
jgi:hypothetical protein